MASSSRADAAGAARHQPAGGWRTIARDGDSVTGSRLVQVISLIALMFWITGSLQDFQDHAGS